MGKKLNLAQKKQICFLLCKKRKKEKGFWRENSDLCLLKKTKSFDLKKIRFVFICAKDMKKIS